MFRQCLVVGLVVLGVFAPLVQCSILVGDSMIPEYRVYSLDTSTSPATVTFLYTIASPDSGAYYGSGCVDSSAGMARLLFRNSTDGESYFYYILSVDLSSGVATKGAQFSTPGELNTEDVKCDSVFHTVILMLISDDAMSLTLYSVTPDSGNITLVAFYTCQNEISLSYGGQVYDSTYHMYYIQNFIWQRPGRREYWYATLAISTQDGSVQYIPYNVTGFEFEDQALTLQTHTANQLAGVNVFIDNSGWQLTYFDFAHSTYTYPGDKFRFSGGVWSVGSATDYEFLYEMGDPNILLSWDLDSGALSISRLTQSFTPHSFLNFYKY
ncbi:hypothetical protein Pelo_9035 [Pelomyxa schiedti]|nr:hypothetical protein Pelo_9035 [Pelomyxa schiedti]